MTQKSIFDARAAKWDDEPRRIELAQQVAGAIMTAVPPTAQMDALDFGCGTGLLTLLLQPHLRSITGVDNSRGMLEVLQQKVAESGVTNVRTQLCDVQRDERPQGTFDLIVSSMTLHHVADPGALFRLFHELLNPGGAVCLADLDQEDGTFHEDHAGVLHFGFSRGRIAEDLARAGFSGISDATAATVKKGSGDKVREYPVFLIKGYKSPTPAG